MPNTPNYHDFFDYPNWAYYPKCVPRDRKNVIKGCVYLADWFEGIDLICRLFVLLVGNSLPNNHSIVTKQKSIGRMLSPNASKVFWIMNYFTSSYIIDTGYQDFPFLWYNYGTKSGIFPHNLTGNTFKELSAKI
ncbi:MAG: hypothetical protein MR891_05300, partial [Bacteroidales bacterium]|nr:hypothetical protein [Bacteroidales bacterium]